MSNTLSSVHLFDERAKLVMAQFEHKSYLTIRDILAAVSRGISVARSLVQEMEAQGMLHIITAGGRRIYLKDAPTPGAFAEHPFPVRPRAENPLPMQFLRSSADRRGNTIFDECRRNSAMYQLQSVFNQRLAARQLAN
ncbi:hypothetical protein [Nissabacter sp. SGAir0207]|uniref:hypothetical protein n=1 Tax=Nissabacter sp. SGAir0207 TaxID=2126321 RepID=UPI0010CD3166|nr:hypothetical protein [Nissabacter sp. SGAir0207]QCR38760.1 hypothetical protein C1N62_21775 [Nissabacter sp. SGAir0207]